MSKVLSVKKDAELQKISFLDLLETATRPLEVFHWGTMGCRPSNSMLNLTPLWLAI